MANAEKGKSTLSHVYLFDLDNTLYPPGHALFQNLLERVYTYFENAFDVDRAEAIALNRKLVQQHGSGFDALVHEHGHDIEGLFKELYQAQDYAVLEACAHTRAAIQNLPGTSYIFTNGPREHAELCLQSLEMTDTFAEIFCFRSAGFRSKPQLPVYEKVLETLSVMGNQCTMIEDSVKNLQPAKELGMCTVFLGEDPQVE